MYICFYGIVSYCLHIHAKNIKKKHMVDRYKVSIKINHRKWITFFSDINMYLNQGKIGIYISVVITVLMK